jgi:hypothetical protein
MLKLIDALGLSKEAEYCYTDMEEGDFDKNIKSALATIKNSVELIFLDKSQEDNLVDSFEYKL